ncbi:unnamed protein product [Meloidogyne enterolobii]|uniref:Uncharacterized protein n=1 Tax=Meloidogyne enterolobii TaxID=390850 RepID=A0ACB0Y0S4_MELEN
MIIERVCKLKTLDLHIFCSSTYKNVFEKYPKLISYFCLNTSIKRKKSEKEIIKEEEEENKKERNGKGICRRLSSIGIFRMLVRRFFNVLQLVLILLEEGQSSIIEQILLEFGGMHANNNRGNEEKEEVEREGEEREEDISLIPQEYWEILLQSLLNLTNKEENIYVKTQNGQHLFDVSTSNYSKRSVEAWTLFCIFIVSKIRFGFVMECFLHSNFKNKKRDVQQKFNKNINSENTQQIIYDFRRNSISNENILFYKEKIK